MYPRIRHLSQSDAELTTPPSNRSVLISVTDPGCPPADLEPGWMGVLRTEFDDIDGRYGDFKLFTWAQALEIIGFLDKHEGADHVFVHCRYGISRSAAIALFAAWLRHDCLGLQAEGFNRLVWNRLLIAYALRSLQRGQIARACRSIRQSISVVAPIDIAR